MSSWVMWILAGLAALGLFFLWPNWDQPAVVIESQKISQSEFSKEYEGLVAQLQRAYAQAGQDFGRFLKGIGGLERRLELQARVLDDLTSKALISQELRRRQIVIASTDIDDRTAIEFEKILKQNRLTEAQAEEILKGRGSSLAQFKKDLREAVAAHLQTERLRDHIVGTLQPGDPELSAYLEQNRERYDEPEQVRARHILIQVSENAPEADVAKAQQQIEQIRQELEAGADFAELAKKHSQDPGSAENGGDLGWFARGRMAKEFEEGAFALEVGKIGEPVRTQFGFHLIKTEEKKPARQPALSEIRAQVLKDYIDEERERRFEAWYKERKSKARIVIRDPWLRVYYALEREQKLDEALAAYEKLPDVYQKAHLARVKTKQLLRLQEASEELHRRKEEIIALWLAQMSALKDLTERAQVISEIAELKPNTIPARAFLHLTVLGEAQEIPATIIALQQRLQNYGIHQSTIVAAGADQLALWLSLPQETSVSAIERLLKTRGLIELKRVLQQGNPGEELKAAGLGQQALKDRAEAEKTGSGRYFLVVERPIVARAAIREARAQGNPAARPAGPIVRISIAASTVEALAKAVALFNENELIAIVIDGVVYGTMPVTASLRALLAQQGSTLGLQIEEAVSVSLAEAQALAFVLQSGPLPANVQLVRP